MACQSQGVGPRSPTSDVKDEGPSGPCYEGSHRCQHCHTGLWGAGSSQSAGIDMTSVCFLRVARAHLKYYRVSGQDIAKEVISIVFVAHLNTSRISGKH